MKALPMKNIESQVIFANASVVIAAFASPAFAHEGHGDTVHHALMHLLEEPDHLLLPAAAGLVILAAWRYFKGKNK